MIRNAVLALILVATASAAQAAEIIEVPDQAAALAADQAVAEAAGGLEPQLIDAQFFSHAEAPPFFRWFWQPDAPAVRRPVAPRRRVSPNPYLSASPGQRIGHERRRSAKSHQAHIARLLRQPPPTAAPKGPLLITVSLSRQKLTVYDAGMRIAESPISSGMPGHPTPMGVFSVLERQSWHTSNIYSNAPMPLMQRLTWSGIALHAGVLPGYPASHGCIRLPESFALQLWHTARVGARVVISRDDPQPAYIQHALLPQPRIPLPTPAPTRPDSPLPNGEDTPVTLFVPPPGDDADAERDFLMTVSDDEDAGSNELTPFDTPRLQHAFSVSEEPDIPILIAMRQRMRKQMDAPRDPEASYSEIYSRPNTAVSIFISRRDSRLYVRRGFQPLFDEPISIAAPELPLGTHVFTAVSEIDGGSKLDWTVVSPNGREAGAAGARRALDRIQLSPEAQDKIAKLVGVGGSLIVSDAGLGATAALPNADFTVVLR
jgi:lipoprotein-anchoring transpeptidase ErfK/SrfK